MPYEATDHLGSRVRIKWLGADAIGSGGEEITVWKHSQAVLLSHPLDGPPVLIVPICLNVRVVAEDIIEHVCHAVVEADEEMACGRTVMPEDHAPHGPFLPTIGIIVAAE